MYTTKTFQTAEEASSYVTVVAAALKQQGYTIQEMTVREGRMPVSFNTPASEIDDTLIYGATVAAYKEDAVQEKKEEEAPAVPTVN